MNAPITCPYCGEPDSYYKWTELMPENGDDDDPFAALVPVEMEDCRACDCEPEAPEAKP